ncbi:MAG: hypothetical protein K6357_07780 [Elusimicrobiota bacterium]
MRFEIDKKVYSYEALNIAKNIIDNTGQIKLYDNKKTIIAEIKGNDCENIFDKLMNEALNEQCRIDLAKKNFRISQLIVTKALISALGEDKWR